MCELIQALSNVMQDGERLRFEIARGKDDTLTILVSPHLSPSWNGDDDDAQRGMLRAALSMPLRITGSVTGLDTDFLALLGSYGAKRGSISKKVVALGALKEASKAAERLAETS